VPEVRAVPAAFFVTFALVIIGVAIGSTPADPVNVAAHDYHSNEKNDQQEAHDYH
jgi:hypothetical protein